jgi:hypothetical protein
MDFLDLIVSIGKRLKDSISAAPAVTIPPVIFEMDVERKANL